MKNTQNRRKFLGKVGMGGAAALAAGLVGAEPLFGSAGSQARAATQTSNQRANECA